MSGTLYNGGNIVLQGEDGGNLSGVIVLRLGGEVYSGLDRDEQVRNWIKYEDGPYYTSGVTEGYAPKYVYYGPTVSPVDITVYMAARPAMTALLTATAALRPAAPCPFRALKSSCPTHWRPRLPQTAKTSRP